MGCNASAPTPRVRQKAPPPPPPPKPQQPELPKDEMTEEMMIQANDFKTIVQGVELVPKPNDIRPIVCLSSASLPIVVSNLCIEEGDSTNIILPTLAISRYKSGRVFLIGDIRLLKECTSENSEASTLLENIVRWTAGPHHGGTSVLLLQIPQADSQEIKQNLDSFGIHVRVSDDTSKIEKAHVIITLSSFKDSDAILNFVSAGGGVIVCADCTKSLPFDAAFALNPILARFGVAFPSCNLIAGPLNTPTVKLNCHLHEMRKCTLSAYSKTLVDILANQQQLDLAPLDSIVTAIRFHVMVMPQGPDPVLSQLTNVIQPYLESRNFMEGGKLCQNLANAILFVLISEISMKLPADAFEGIDRSDFFPGKVSGELLSQTVSMPSGTEGWFSTGLWLPGGKVSEVAFKQYSGQKLRIQIGMHSESLLSKGGPWTRWPVAISTFEVGSQFKVASPYGGMVYVLSESPTEADFEFEFTNVTRYPLFSVSNHSWAETKAIDTRWGELETRRAFFVLPREKMDVDLKAFSEYIDELIDIIVDFTAAKISKKFRVVFDVEMGESGSVCGYPIVMSVDSISPILQIDSPSSELFTLLAYIAVLSLPENGFTDDQEASIGHVAACTAFKRRWPKQSPLDYSCMLLPQLFNDIWNIRNNYGSNVITSALHKIREAAKNGQIKEYWVPFVKSMSAIAKMRFDNLIPRASQKQANEGGNKIMSNSSASLQTYQLSDFDISELK